MKRQPVQTALLVLPGYDLSPFHVHTLSKSKSSARKTERFVKRRYEALSFVQPEEEARRRVEQRTLRLKQAAGVLPAKIIAAEHDPFDNDAI